MPPDYTLYGVEGSYYAAKARSCLLQKSLSFQEVQCDRRAFAEVIIPRIGYPIVPVLITPDDETLQDTAEVVDVLEAKHPLPNLIPNEARSRFVAYLIEFYADEWLKQPALHYRWYYDYEFAHQMMGYNNDPHASTGEQARVGAKIAQNFKTWPEHLGVSDATRGAVERNFLALLELLESHYQQHDYALGAKPSIADCALMGPLYAHLYRDPYSGNIVQKRAPNLCTWIERMRRRRDEKLDTKAITHTIPETLIPILQHCSRDYLPILETAMPILQAWLGDNRAAEIPRYVGKHPYTLGRDTPYEAQGMRSIHSFEQWKLQRVLDVYASYDKHDKERVESVLEQIDARALLSFELPNRLARRQHRLVHAGTE